MLAARHNCSAGALAASPCPRQASGALQLEGDSARRARDYRRRTRQATASLPESPLRTPAPRPRLRTARHVPARRSRSEQWSATPSRRSSTSCPNFKSALGQRARSRSRTRVSRPWPRELVCKTSRQIFKPVRCGNPTLGRFDSCAAPCFVKLRLCSISRRSIEYVSGSIK
jgi:hypothetical protein